MNIAIMRAFVKLRETLSTNAVLAAKFEELARTVATHDEAIARRIQTIRDLMNPPPATKKKRAIGFQSWVESR